MNSQLRKLIFKIILILVLAGAFLGTIPMFIATKVHAADRPVPCTQMRSDLDHIVVNTSESLLCETSGVNRMGIDSYDKTQGPLTFHKSQFARVKKTLADGRIIWGWKDLYDHDGYKITYFDFNPKVGENFKVNRAQAEDYCSKMGLTLPSHNQIRMAEEHGLREILPHAAGFCFWASPHYKGDIGYQPQSPKEGCAYCGKNGNLISALAANAAFGNSALCVSADY